MVHLGGSQLTVSLISVTKSDNVSYAYDWLSRGRV